MSAYGSLAVSYDRLTGDVPYGEILAFVQNAFSQNGALRPVLCWIWPAALGACLCCWLRPGTG